MENFILAAKPRITTREIEMISLVVIPMWNSPVAQSHWVTEETLPLGEGKRQIGLAQRWAHSRKIASGW